MENLTTQEIRRMVYPHVLWIIALLYLSSSVFASLSVTPTVSVINLETNTSGVILLQLTVSGSPATISLSWSNFSHTTLTTDKTSWTNFQGSDVIQVTVARTTLENKSRHFELNFTSMSPDTNNFTVVLETRMIKHPLLLFNDVSEIQGLQYYTKTPWSTWRSYINSARASNKVSGIMDYYITNSTVGLDYTKTQLVNFVRTPGDGRNINRVNELHELVYAYDFVQPFLNDSEDILVRGKIAELADQVYYDLNHNGVGADIWTVQCVDYHFRAYSVLGIAGLLLMDYSNTSLPHSSTSEDWFKVGTEYFFVLDPLHPFGRSMFSNCVDSEGRDLVAGDYRGYYWDELNSFSQVYFHYYNKTLFEDYSILSKWIVAPLFYTLPNKYETNYATSGHFKWEDARMWLNMLDTINQSYMWKYYNDITSDNTLPYSRTFGYVADIHPITEVAFITYKDYSGVPFSTHDDSTVFTNSDYQVFRKDWTNTSSWLTFTTFRSLGTENRFMMHNDQFSFEYYDKGNYLIGDSGEVKYRKTFYSEAYGPIDAKGHNSIMFSDASIQGVGGIYKGVYGTLYTNASVGSSLISNNIDFLESQINISKTEQTNSYGESQDITESVPMGVPLPFTRSIMYPQKDYFLVLDYVNNSVNRKIYNLFHLTSFYHSATTSSFNGSVYGNLTVALSKVDWNLQSYNTEVNITNGSSLSWNTTNVLNQNLETHLFSIPQSEISVEKFWIRVGGHEGLSFGGANEVDHPLVRFKVTTDEPLYRITSFYTRYLNESEKSFTDIPVSGGSGSALRIQDGVIEDLVFLGKGNEFTSADKMKSRARIAFCRTNNSVLDYFFLNDGKEFVYDSVARFNSSAQVMAMIDYQAAKIEGRMEGTGSYQVAIKTGFGSIDSVKWNGAQVSYTQAGDVVTFTVSGAGDLEILGSGVDLSISSGEIFFSQNAWIGSPTTLSATIRNVGGENAGSFQVRFYDGATVINTATVASLASGASTNVNVSWTPATGGNRTIYAVADYAGAIEETEEGNNNASTIVYVGFPADLAISTTDISYSNSQPTEGETITIYATIRNNGGVDVNNLVVFFDGIPAVGVQIGNRTVDVPKQSSVQTSISWVASPEYTHAIYISLDHDNQISESNEANNVAYKNIYVRTKPDPAITASSNITLNPDPITVGLPETIGAVIKNLGETNASSFTVRFYDNGSLIGDTTASIAAGAVAQINRTWTPASNGSHNISVTIDPTGTLTEHNESNNIASRIITVVSSGGTTTTVTTTSSTTTTTQAQIPYTFGYTGVGAASDSTTTSYMNTFLLASNASQAGTAYQASFYCGNGASFRVALYAVENNYPTTRITQNDASHTATCPASPGWVNITFQTPAQINANTQYALSFDPVDATMTYRYDSGLRIWYAAYGSFDDPHATGWGYVSQKVSAYVWYTPSGVTTTTTQGTTTTTQGTTTTTTQGTTTSTATTTTTSPPAVTTTTSTTTSTTTTTHAWLASLSFGGRGSSSGQLYEPVDLVVDIEGDIIVLERANERLQNFTSAGQAIRVYESVYGLDEPESLDMRWLGDDVYIVVADTKNHRVQVLDLFDGGYNWSVFGQRCYDVCNEIKYIFFEYPSGVAIGSEENKVIVGDTGNDRVTVFNASDSLALTAAGRSSYYPEVDGPTKVAYNDPLIYVADTGNGRVLIMHKNGTSLLSFGANGTGKYGFSGPKGIAVDGDGNVYVADTGNGKIKIYNPAGIYLTEFGSVNCSLAIQYDSQLSKGQFCGPEGIEVAEGNVYVADTGNHRIQVFPKPENYDYLGCVLSGDYSPCGDVTLGEVIEFITLWSVGEAELADVISLITAWAGG